MIGFFMLSGYSLQLAYHHKELTEGRNIKEFLLKRFIAIYPLYIVVGLLSVLMLIGAGKQMVIDNILLLPVELLGIQSFFDGSLFSYAHNSGTWFVSCIIICYICFPFLKGFAKEIAIKNAVWLLVAVLSLLVYVHYLPAKYECGNLYTNPMFRLLEFIAGMLTAKINIDCNLENKTMSVIRSWVSLLLSLIVLVAGYAYCRYAGIKSYFLVYPCLTFILIAFGSMRLNPKPGIYKAILYISSLTYAVFLCQAFVWNPAKFIQIQVGEFSNGVKIVGTLLACVMFSVVFHELVENKLGGFLKKKLLTQ